MMRLQAVSKRRGSASQRFSLEIERLHLRAGQVLGLVGPSGCGKSTVLDLLALTLAPDQAEHFSLHAEGGEHDLAQLWRNARRDQLAALRSRQMGYVLQTGGLLGFLDVRDNIALPRQLLGLADDGSVERLATALELDGHLRHYPAELSVGQRQRVGCARALVHAPQLLLADEPTAALDPLNAERVMRLLLSQVRQAGAACVIASHDEPLLRAAGVPVLRMGCRRDGDGGVTSVLEVGH
ncbi:ABC transporter ATP-binding protein [Pseudomonas cremoricolorata]|uniref:ABC transporter ATP-binding protein n=1 Tax=Pseudomonas cremoricolorata TaxID=157783 RepID=A0A089WQ25_9PSED|nr:ATP-binding cassette domain-containing protein [Pseudomonas cremoricolorata]AIR88597.1 ABC transporter ATP-binding protein [Pseudomonas cremoricolorata]